MKKIILTVALAGFSLVFLGSLMPESILQAQDKSSKTGYMLKAKVAGIKDTACYIAYHFGDKKFIKDTAKTDGSGRMTFSGKDALPGGIYLLVLPNKTYFEFIIDNQQSFSLETDTLDFIHHMKVTGSSDNQLFYEYLKFITSRGKKADSLTKLIKGLENKDSATVVSLPAELTKLPKDSVAAFVKRYRTQGRAVEREIQDYKENYVKAHPATFLAKIFTSMPEPNVPDSLVEKNKSDSTFSFRWYKKHFFDNVDLTDDRLLRTPVLHGKIEKYIQKLTIQIPDSINKEADYLIEKARPNKEVFKFIVHYITNTYERSNIMGMDAVFVHMAEKYYATGQAYWTDSAQQAKITERAKKIKPTLVGNITPNVILPDTSGKKWYNLHKDVKSPYTVLVFWDSGCGHCKKEVPKLKEIYEKYKDKGIVIFCVGTETDNKDWVKYVRDNNLKWINVKDNEEIRKNPYPYLGAPYFTTVESLNYRSTYDIYSTPRIFLLDVNKKIIAKQIGAEQLEEILEKKLNYHITNFKDVPFNDNKFKEGERQ